MHANKAMSHIVNQGSYSDRMTSTSVKVDDSLGRKPFGTVGEGDTEGRFHLVKGKWVDSHRTHVGRD